MLKKLLPLLCLLYACDATTPDSGTTPQDAAASAAAAASTANAALARAGASGVKPMDIEGQLSSLTGKFARSWLLTSRTQGGADATLDCYRDDHVIFYREHRIDFNIGQSACRRGELTDKNTTGRWQPTSAYDVLLFIGTEAPYLVKILELTASRMVLQFTDVDGSIVVETYKPAEDLTTIPSALDGILATPKPAATATPKPAATATPKPTTTPKPVATATPKAGPTPIVLKS